MSTAEIKAYLASIGAKGGQATTKAKKKSGQINAAKARAAAKKAREGKKGKG